MATTQENEIGRVDFAGAWPAELAAGLKVSMLGESGSVMLQHYDPEEVQGELAGFVLAPQTALKLGVLLLKAAGIGLQRELAEARQRAGMESDGDIDNGG